jgi:putative two-component system response regulator
MPDTFYTGTNIKRIIELLPLEEAEHMKRVGILVDIMATKLRGTCFYPEDSDMGGEKYYGEAAAYHDIGKVMVLKYLLKKPDRLTKEENIIMKKHPLFARELFDRINHGFITGIPKHLFKPAYDSAVYHHEWWNGEGYPYGISSNNIPLVARITSICDAYDAITSNRSYRKARSHDYACSELEAKSGIQFDPQLVRVFLDHEAEFSMFINKMVSVCFMMKP